MKKIYQIRPHHGMCIAYFRGNGYSQKFTQHMEEMIAVFHNNPKVRVVLHMDEICSTCPNDLEGICATQEKVLRYDQGVLKACNFTEGMEMEAAAFFQAVEQKVLKTGLRKKICGDCSWNEICEALE